MLFWENSLRWDRNKAKVTELRAGLVKITEGLQMPRGVPESECCGKVLVEIKSVSA